MLYPLDSPEEKENASIQANLQKTGSFCQVILRPDTLFRNNLSYY